MIRVLAMIAVAGFLLSAACLGAAVAIAGPEFITNGAWAWSGPWSHRHWGNSRHGFGLSYNLDDDDDHGPASSRETAFSGESLEVDVPAEVHFTQAAGAAKVVIRGPQRLLDHVTVDGGRIGYDRGNFSGEKLQIEVTAPKVTRFELNGTGRIDVDGYQQSNLDVQLSGDGEFAAKGRADSVHLNISGSGEADLSALENDATEVTISGSGRAKIRPKSSARLDISGSGDVEMLSKPKHLESHVSGSGNIEQNEDATTDEPAAPAPPAKPAKAGKKT